MIFRFVFLIEWCFNISEKSVKGIFEISISIPNMRQILREGLLVHFLRLPYETGVYIGRVRFIHIRIIHFKRGSEV